MKQVYKRVRNSLGQFEKRINLSKDELYQKYHVENKSSYKIGKEIGCSSVYICYLLKEYNISPKSKTILNNNESLRLCEEHASGLRKDSYKKISDTIKDKWLNDTKYIKKIRLADNKKERIEKIRQSVLKRWEDLDYKNRVLKKTIMKGLNRPNLLELSVFNILERLFPSKYKYVGNGEIMIDGYNPDFINCNGQKKIIEVYGDYWHTIPKAINRDKLRLITYKKYGYDTLIIWEHELKNVSLLEKKLLDFTPTDWLCNKWGVAVPQTVETKEVEVK